MTTRKKRAAHAPSETVHLYPMAGAYIPGVPAVEQDVDGERAEELLAYRPPAFTTDPADAATEPVRLYLEQPQEPAPPEQPADETTEAPPEAGSLDVSLKE